MSGLAIELHSFPLVPAKAGTQSYKYNYSVLAFWIPAFAGMSG